MVSRVAAEVAWIRLYEKGLLSIAGYDGLASFSWTGQFAPKEIGRPCHRRRPAG